MPLQQISVSPLDWGKENINNGNQDQEWRMQEPVYASSQPHQQIGHERSASQASTLSTNHDICRGKSSIDICEARALQMPHFLFTHLTAVRHYFKGEVALKPTPTLCLVPFWPSLLTSRVFVMKASQPATAFQFASEASICLTVASGVKMIPRLHLSLSLSLLKEGHSRNACSVSSVIEGHKE
ncbi:hypothetical protein J437_LFUL013011 [Ladona fulva]|uniref:Uncharacterized protein n=1 Tax=Ladona fulva TaxID=123851 RepID=A0A8K0KL87_LADFU|nr:hypothetical protein J437_LFUL013011 [Ladona fulva]